MVKGCGKGRGREGEARSWWTSQRHFLLPYRLIKRFTRAPRADRRPSSSFLVSLVSISSLPPSLFLSLCLAPSLFTLLFFTCCNSNDCEERTTATTTMTTGTHGAQHRRVHNSRRETKERCDREGGRKERTSERERRGGERTLPLPGWRKG